MKGLKNIVFIICLIFLSVSGIAQEKEKKGLKGARIVGDINPDFLSKWVYSNGSTSFTLVLVKRTNLYVKHMDATFDCLEGQFDYIKNDTVIARNINGGNNQQISIGLQVKNKPTIVYAVYTYADVSTLVELELVNKNTLKWTINGDPNEGLRNDKTFKPREVVVPRTLILSRFL